MKLKLARIKVGITQSQLCKKIRMSPKKLVEAERGNCQNLTLAQMKALAKELNSDVQTLFFSDQENPDSDISDK